MLIKIPDVSGLVTTTVSNKKISEVENKILVTSSLVTTTALNTKIGEVENKIRDHAKYITTQYITTNFRNVCCKVKISYNLVSKTDFDNKLISFNGKITSNKKHI